VDSVELSSSYSSVIYNVDENQYSFSYTHLLQIGLEGTEETVKWLWNKHFAAVASDTLAFEVWLTKPPFSMESSFLEMRILANT
jgi:hypothetical protein